MVNKPLCRTQNNSKQPGNEEALPIGFAFTANYCLFVFYDVRSKDVDRLLFSFPWVRFAEKEGRKSSPQIQCPPHPYSKTFSPYPPLPSVCGQPFPLLSFFRAQPCLFSCCSSLVNFFYFPFISRSLFFRNCERTRTLVHMDTNHCKRTFIPDFHPSLAPFFFHCVCLLYP